MNIAIFYWRQVCPQWLQQDDNVVTATSLFCFGRYQIFAINESVFRAEILIKIRHKC